MKNILKHTKLHLNFIEEKLAKSWLRAEWIAVISELMTFQVLGLCICMASKRDRYQWKALKSSHTRNL